MARKIDGRLAYADLLRAFATLAVVVLHLAGSQMGAVAVSSSAWGVFNLYDGLVRWCVPVFVMLSGMFLLDPKRGLPLSKLLFHNALRILVCLLFWGTVYALAEFWAAGDLSIRALCVAAASVLTGNTHYHLWFLYMILGLYLVTPVLRAFVRGASRGDFHWFFLLAFLFASLLPTAFRLWPNATHIVKIWYDRLAVQTVLGYVGFYVAGYYLKEYTLGRLAEAVIYVLGVLGAVATVWGTRVLSLRSGGLDDTLYGYFSPNVVCFAVAVVVLFRYVLGVSDERSRRQRLGGVARIAFGVYLVHDLFLMLLRHFGVTTLSFAPVASVPVLAAGVFLCSLAVAWLISKIPFVGRWLT
ncbi:acyltransferase family protein [Pseudoflavonifractor phocaeensis]|uniref:acyltransferase n=1 Tax=Pseudoflavonifractor phocaeensis TaxID=1870988 RepID=UPI00313C1DF3